MSLISDIYGNLSDKEIRNLILSEDLYLNGGKLVLRIHEYFHLTLSNDILENGIEKFVLISRDIMIEKIIEE